MKHLIVLADGTWCTPDQEENGIPTPTNVVRLRNSLASKARVASGRGADRLIEQRAYYHPGVGTDGGILKKATGGVWGQGLSDNIQSAYHWLALNYKPGDQIFLFGFSRGAYTVRSLAGVLGRCGLLNLSGVNPAEGWDRVDAAYEEGYRKKRDQAEWARRWAFHHKSETPIRFIGVWDTVGALGIPDDVTLLNLFDIPRNWRFHNTTLGDNVEIARHAVALDEMRASFTPTLWTRKARSTDFRQVWFPGTHSDIGGGYVECGLSNASLSWMITEAEKAGLAFSDHAVAQVTPDPMGVLHDSMKGIFKAHRSRPRNTPVITSRYVHESARQRQKTPPIDQSPYRPTTIVNVGKTYPVDVFACEHWNHTGLYLKPGKYHFTASGEWLDKSIPCGPGGTADGEFHVGEVSHLIGTGIGWLEAGWRNITSQENAEFKMTRRHDNWPWFALIGAVANSDRKPASDGTPPPHQAFLIGEKSTLTLSRGGYLFCYANDAWNFYRNNRGSVQLKVQGL